MTHFNVKLVAKTALLLPHLKDRANQAERALHLYCLRYGYGKLKHQNYVDRFMRADKHFCRAINFVRDAAGLITHYPKASRRLP